MGRVFNSIVHATTGLPFLDTQCGFKAFHRAVAKPLFRLSRQDGFAFDVEVLTIARRLDYRIVEVPVHWHSVAHSHVRPLRDSAKMTGDVVRASMHWRGRRLHTQVRRQPRGVPAA